MIYDKYLFFGGWFLIGCFSFNMIILVINLDSFSEIGNEIPRWFAPLFIIAEGLLVLMGLSFIESSLKFKGSQNFSKVSRE